MEPELGTLDDGDFARDRARARGGCTGSVWLVVLLVAALAAAWWQRDRVLPALCTDLVAADRADRGACVAALPDATRDRARPSAEEPPEAPEIGAEDPSRGRAWWIAATGSEPEWPARLTEPTDCAQVDAALRHLTDAIDARPWARELELPKGSHGLVTGLVSSVVVAPPDPDPVLQDIDALLGNLFYSFRALDAGERVAARRILTREPELTEPLAFALYRWLASRERCAAADSPRVEHALLGRGAAFLLDSFGGQALLSRRSPRVEALARFYAVAELDRLERAGQLPYRLDLHALARRTREQVAAQDLALGESYVAYLAEIESRLGPAT